MPGNEAAEKVHNFFEQDNVSQGQASGNWSVLNNNPWVCSQRQNGTPLSSLKNYNLQSSDSEIGNGRQSSLMSHGTNLTQLTLRPDFSKGQSRSQHLNLNGFMHNAQGFQTRSNQAEFLGEDTVSDRHNLTSKNLAILESQQGNAPERSESAEVPVNFDFLGGQQQLMRGQQTGMPQSRSRQQSGFNDMQLWQQHVMYKQLQELHRQQQLQQLDQSLVNNTPIHDTSNYGWPNDLMGGNMNWVQRSGSPALQGFPSGLVISHDQGHALRSMGFIPQQLDQSLYGAPVASTRGSLNNQYSNFQGVSRDCSDMLTKAGGIQVEKPIMQVGDVFNSFQGDQSAVFPEQICIQDGVAVSKQEIQGKNLFAHAPLQSLNNGVMLGDFQQGNNSLPRNLQEQEKAGGQGGPSQGLVNLDLTEEKILFNTGDTVCYSPFGRSGGTSTGVYMHGNQLENTDCLNAFPSVQSGSWSALMQSAVAEASSSDTGIQDEWSGLSFQKAEMSTLDDSGKQQTTWVNDNLHTAASLNSRPFPLFDDANMSPSGCNVPGFQESSKEASQWLDRSPQQKPPVEGSLQVQQTPIRLEDASVGAWASHVYEHSGNAAPNMGLNAQNMQGSWTHQQSTASYNVGSQPSSKQNGWNINESLSPNGDGSNDSTIHGAHSTDPKRAMHVETLERDCDDGMWKVGDNQMAGSYPTSTGGLDQVKPGMGSPQVHTEDSHMNNFPSLPNSRTSKMNQEMNQQVLNSHHIDYRKHAILDSSVSYRGNKNMGKFDHQPNKGPQARELSMTNSVRGLGGSYDKKQENYSQNDGHVSNDSHPGQHSVTGGNVRENAWSGASDSRSFGGGSQKNLSQVGRKPPVSRKFQYHPMGNLGVNVEPGNTTKQVSHPQGLPQSVNQGPKIQDKVHFGHSKLAGHSLLSSATDMEKGHLTDSSRNFKGAEEVISRGVFHGYGSSMSSSFDRPAAIHTPSKRDVQTSQNMLELFHKVDQSREDKAAHFGSSDYNLAAEMPETSASDASVTHTQHNQSSTSQGFGLHLGPPSQRLSISNQGQTGNETMHPNLQQNISPAVMHGLPYSRNQLQQLHVSSGSGQAKPDQSINMSFASQSDLHSHQTDANSSYPSSSLKQFPVLESAPTSQPSVTLGTSQQGVFSKMLHNVWTNVSAQKHLSGGPSPKVSPIMLQSINQSADSMEKVSLAPQKPDDQSIDKGGDDQSEFATRSIKTERSAYREEQLGKNTSLGQEPVEKHLSEANSVTFDSSFVHPHQHDHGRGKHAQDPSNTNETFGCSIKSTDASHPNYSLLHQMEAMKGAENNPSKKGGKRHKVADTQHMMAVKKGQMLGYGFNTSVRDHVDNDRSEPDTKMLSFSSERKEDQKANSSSRFCVRDLHSDKISSLRNGPQSHSSYLSTASGQSSLRETENPQINPQMAPSWFEQYGSYKNGQILATCDGLGSSWRAPIATSQFSFEKVSGDLHTRTGAEQIKAADASQVGSVWQSTASTMGANQHLSSSQSLPPDDIDRNLVSVRPKKRKSVTAELIPWHKEILQGSRRLYNTSMTELDWAQAANRLIEKVEDEAEMVEDGPSMPHPRRRLILTTQLMQQLLHSIPSAILFAEASSAYESVTYLVAKLALGDACSLISCSESDSCMHLDNGNTISEKLKPPEMSRDQFFSKIAEDLIARARKLESDLSRLDKRGSLLDVRVECQDLERFSIINRFAKFHGRGHTDGAESSSSSEPPTVTRKMFPQRYVTAFSMPRNVPEGVPCLSL